MLMNFAYKKLDNEKIKVFTGLLLMLIYNFCKSSLKYRNIYHKR